MKLVAKMSQTSILMADQQDEAEYLRTARTGRRTEIKAGNHMPSPEAKRLLGCGRLCWSRNHYGLSVVMAGHMTLAMVVSIMFWQVVKNVNVLVLDTEVYSNTGGQMSKATPVGAVAKFAAGGKPAGKKDLGMMAMNYGNVYVAQVAMGANDTQVLRAFLEAEAYDGPSLIIAYSHCIAHGINMGTAMNNQKAAVQSGHWMLYRYHPEKGATRAKIR